MSTLSEREQILRRALLSAAESIEPGADGLQRIQSRLRPAPRSLPVAWAEAFWTELVLRAPVGWRSASSRIAASVRAAWHRYAPGAGTAAGRGARSLRLLRPLAAAAAVVLVAAGAYVAFDAPQGFFPNSSSSPLGRGGNSAGSGGNGTSGTTNSNHNGVLPFPGSGKSGGSGSSPACTTSPAPKKSSGTAPASSPSSGSSSSSASPSDTPSPSTSVSPSPTVSSSPNPSVSGSDQPTTNPIDGDSTPPGTGVSRQVVPSPSPSPNPCGSASHSTRDRAQKVKVHPEVAGSPDAISAAPLDAVRGRPAGRAAHH